MKTHRVSPAIIAAFLATCLVFAAAVAQAADLPDFTALAEKAGPAVVNISAESKPKPFQRGPGMMPSPFGQGSPFDDFFNQFDQFGRGMPMQRKQHSLGSGFIISADGFVLTNNHVVDGADKIMVKLQKSQKEYPAKVVGQDPDTDLALIKIDDKGLPFLKLGDSGKAKVGQWVLAIGNPFGLDHTVTKGIISAKGRVIGAGPYDDFLQTDASINPGNSGGPLIDMNGEVVGINAAIVASGQGIGFAIPSDMAKDVVDQLKTGKKIHRGLLGVAVQDMDQNTAKALGIKDQKGALVVQLTQDGPAAKAGIASGDVITQVNGQDVADSRDLTKRIGRMAPGGKVTVTVQRNGETKKFDATLEERDAKNLARLEGADQGGATQDAVLGLELKTLNPKEAKAYGVAVGKGLLVTAVDPESAASDAGVRRGDVIVEMNQAPVKSVEDARRIIKEEGKARGAVMLLIVRQGQQIIRTVPLN